MKPGPKVKPKIYSIILEPDLKAMERKKEFYFNAYLAKDFKPREHLASDSTYLGLQKKVLDILNTDAQPKDRVNPTQLQFKIY